MPWMSPCKGLVIQDCSERGSLGFSNIDVNDAYYSITRLDQANICTLEVNHQHILWSILFLQLIEIESNAAKTNDYVSDFSIPCTL